MSLRHWMVSCLLALAGFACKCGNNLGHVSSALVAKPASIDFGNAPINVKTPQTFVLTNTGAVPVNLSGAQVTGDTRSAFSATLTASELSPGGNVTVTVNYDPPAIGADSATVGIESDSGTVDVAVKGVGVDLCKNVSCTVTGTGAVAACAGTCAGGACQYPTGIACSDAPNCLTNGTCDGMGHCTGTNDCQKAGTATCTNNNMTVTGQLPPGLCNGQGTCQYNTTTKPCTCGCVTDATGAHCQENWVPVPGAPTGEYSSVWTSASGDLWVALINRTSASSQVNPHSIRHLSNGTWANAGTIAFAENPTCSGSGCGLTLTGDGNGNIYGATDCQDNACSSGGGGGGVWKSASGTATDEWFGPPASLNGCTGSNTNIPLTAVVSAGGSAYAINNAPCGPEIVKENTAATPAWAIQGVNFNLLCQAPGAFWASSTTDFYLAWGCSNGGSGGIYHWDGVSSSPTTQMTFSAGLGDFAAAMFGTSSSDVWAVGTHRWHYNGTSWSEDPTPMPSGGTDTAVWGNGTDYFAAGSYPDMYHYTGGTWVLECVSDNGTGALNDPSVSSVWGDGQGNFYATANWSIAGGKIASGLMKRQ